MAIFTLSASIISDVGKLQNSPALTVAHPNASETVIEVKKAPLEFGGTVAGFTSGGAIPTRVTTIDKFPFSQTSGTATDVGDLSQARVLAAGQSSSTEGFSSGGFVPAEVTTIDKFPFSQTSGIATYIGDLSQARRLVAGQSSTTDGFTSGGYTGSIRVTTIDKFPFSQTSGTTADIGDLSQARSNVAGQQD